MKKIPLLKFGILHSVDSYVIICIMEYIAPGELIPYGKNAKKHPAEQVKLIANSIKQFGFRQPIVVDKNNVVVIGHGRLLAAKRLKLKTVPVERIDDLTEDQIKALRLADNKVAESKWSDDLIKAEILDIDLDMSDFGFDIDFGDDEQEQEQNEDDDDPFDLIPRAQHNVFENFERAQFESDNYYGIPVMRPTQTKGHQFLRFMDWNEIDDPENYIAHFYYDDFKFMSAWRDPDKYIEKLRKFKAVVSPDFSSYTDFPIVLQILGAYRRNWCGAYWQTKGIDVIPDVQWGNEETFKWCFDGIPKDATVAISSLGVKGNKEFNGVEDTLFKKGFEEMMSRLHPKTILWYGDQIDGCECDAEIIHIPSFYEQKRELLNKQKGAKNGKK